MKQNTAAELRGQREKLTAALQSAEKQLQGIDPLSDSRRYAAVAGDMSAYRAGLERIAELLPAAEEAERQDKAEARRAALAQQAERANRLVAETVTTLQTLVGQLDALAAAGLGLPSFQAPGRGALAGLRAPVVNTLAAIKNVAPELVGAQPRDVRAERIAEERSVITRLEQHKADVLRDSRRGGLYVNHLVENDDAGIARARQRIAELERG